MNVVDRRRLLGPANAKIPAVGESSSHDDMEIIPTSQKRPSDIRNFFVKTGLLSNANGSSYIEVEDTIIEVAVFGPRPIRGSFIERASFSVECKFLPYISQPNDQIFNTSTGTSNRNGRSGLTNVEQKISTYVETALLSSIILEKYPKSTIDVFINIISFNPRSNTLLNLINWTINCSSLALVDSGVEIRDMVTSGHLKLNENEKILDAGINDSGDTECVMSFMKMKNNEIVALWIEGEQNDIDETKLNSMVEGCSEMSTQIRQNLNAFLLDSVSEK